MTENGMTKEYRQQQHPFMNFAF